MAKHFYTHIDLRNNQLLKATLENVDSTAVVSGSPGRVFWATDLSKPCYWDGTQVFEFFYRGEALDPSTIVQTGLDATAQEFLVTQIEKDTWNQLATDSTGFEYQANKNQVGGYAGLQDSTDTRPGKLALETLWNGMVIEVPDGTNMVYKTWGELLDEPFGIPQLDATSKLDPYVLNQAGFDATELVLLVSQDEKDRWDTLAIDGTDVELITRKDQPNGYAGLDANAQQPHETQTEGVVIRDFKIVEFFLDGPGDLGNIVFYSFEDGPSYFFIVDSTSDDKATVLHELFQHFNSTPPQNTRVNCTFDGSAILNFNAMLPGDNFNLTLGFGGTWTGIPSTLSPAFYDLSNIGGVPSIGFAPLNAAGIVENQYLPDYKDIKIVDTYADMLAIPVGDRFNGMRVHVIDAVDDPNNTDSSGWAEYLWVDQPPTPAYWLRTAERESAVDINHNSTLAKQGGLPATDEFYHLSYVQYERIDDMEYVVRIANQDISSQPNTQLQLLSFDATTFRAAKIMLTIEDNGPGYQGTQLQEVTLMFDGNYPFVLEYGEIGNILTNPVAFIPDQDINTISLYAASDSTNMSFFIRVKEFDAFDAINPPLTPNVDLLPADGLFPDYIADGGQGTVPSGSQTPGPPLVPGSP